MRIMQTQQQPAEDQPAHEQLPLIERIAAGSQKIKEKKTNVLFISIICYLISFGVGFLVLILINKVFSSASPALFASYNTTSFKLGIPIALLITLLLSIVLPFLLAKSRRLSVMLVTIFLQFLTLIILVVLGLHQLAIRQGGEIVFHL